MLEALADLQGWGAILTAVAALMTAWRATKEIRRTGDRTVASVEASTRNVNRRAGSFEAAATSIERLEAKVDQAADAAKAAAESAAEAREDQHAVRTELHAVRRWLRIDRANVRLLHAELTELRETVMEALTRRRTGPLSRARDRITRRRRPRTPDPLEEDDEP